MIRRRIATHPVVLRKVDATITRPLAPSDTRDAVHREWATRPLGIAQGSDGQRQPASSVRLMPRGFPDLSWHADGPGCSGCPRSVPFLSRHLPACDVIYAAAPDRLL